MDMCFQKCWLISKFCKGTVRQSWFQFEYPAFAKRLSRTTPSNLTWRGILVYWTSRSSILRLPNPTPYFFSVGSACSDPMFLVNVLAAAHPSRWSPDTSCMSEPSVVAMRSWKRITSSSCRATDMCETCRNWNGKCFLDQTINYFGMLHLYKFVLYISYIYIYVYIYMIIYDMYMYILWCIHSWLLSMGMSVYFLVLLQIFAFFFHGDSPLLHRDPFSLEPHRFHI